MCGIVGVFNNKNAEKLVDKALEKIKTRNLKGKRKHCEGNNCLGHCDHSIFSLLNYPVVSDGVLAANCKLFNWKELNTKYKMRTWNDADLILKMIELKSNESNSREAKSNESDGGINGDNIIAALDELDGSYAFCYWKGGKVVLARDILGIKPLWYNHAEGLHFASERKALEENGMIGARELDPRKIIIYDIEADRIQFVEREFFKVSKKTELKWTKEKFTLKTKELVEKAILKTIPSQKKGGAKNKFGILFSGGIDSTVIAKVCKDAGYDFTCYTTTVGDSEDLSYAKKVAEKMGFNLKIIELKEKDVEKYLKKIMPLMEENNVVKVEVGLTAYVACEQAKKDGCEVIYSGLGSEEIFAGYQRHKESIDINEECVKGLLGLHKRDLYRDDVLTINSGLELRTPFLDNELIEFALKIPSKYKIKDGKEKLILRYAAQKMGVMKEVIERKKKACQYGSNVDKLIRKIATKKKMKRFEYFQGFYHNIKLGALVSSGKDSMYALHIMAEQGYPVECLISLRSANKASYMFHSPNIDLVSMQAECLDIPLMMSETKGVKEKELKDLENALKAAKEKYGIQGITTGALFSEYQKERVEKICKKLGLLCFSPLWHKEQETELREILNEGFEIILSAVAAEGLDKSWLGRRITQKDVDKLVWINKRIGINIAFEGGEAESLVLDAPLFKKRIEVVKGETIMERENTGVFVVKKAKMVEK